MSLPSQTERRVSNPPADRPLMIFDGDCNFCRRWILRWQKATAGRVDYRAFQEIASQFPEIPREAFEQSVQFIEQDGRVTVGADAVFRALDFSPEKKLLPSVFRCVPALMPLARAAYRFVARHRKFFSKITHLLG